MQSKGKGKNTTKGKIRQREDKTLIIENKGKKVNKEKAKENFEIKEENIERNEI